MKSKNVKVIDEHNIDRDANVMFALELDGSEYVVYWIARDEESNNVFVSKVLRNIDGTYNMLNIDDEDKKKEIADIVKTLISNSVSDQKDKLEGITTTLSNGKVAKFVNVSFNKEQHISVAKTYITTVKKEVTKVADNYYDVAVEEAKVESVLPAVPAVEPVQEVFPELVTPAVETPAVTPAPVVVEPITVAQPAQPSVVPATPIVETPVAVVTPVEPVVAPQPVVAQVVPTTAVVEPVAVVQPVIAPTPVVVEPVPVVQTAQPSVVPATPVVETPVAVVTPVEPVVTPQPVVAPVVPTASAVETPQVVPPVTEPATILEPANQPLVFNASKETNLNAALGEVANSTTISVENIAPVREFGVETPVVAPAPPVVAPMVQPETAEVPKTLTKKAGFANSKFFMVVAIAFFLASCVFLGYEVFNYFQLVK